ncbi:MAG: alpha/beta fold hydrolase [Frankiales bacterium]|nr:alpha/beta fold hydrolase [Frankiales bacterium]
MRTDRRTVLLASTAVGAAALLRRRRATAARAAASRPAAAPVPQPAGRPRTVLTEDGVELAVTEHGAMDARVTVVLAHGYTQSSALWAGQVRDLVDTRPDWKVVTYDHRGHGRSGRTPRDQATLDQLGRDLAGVIEAVAPTGPVVLAGHSMGGMSLLALAEHRPELFGQRVVACAFVATSAGRLSEVTWGLPAPVARLTQRLLPRLHQRAVVAELAGQPRKTGPFDARLIFPAGADPLLVQLTLQDQLACTAETVAAFYATFSGHDRVEALAAIAPVPALVVVGDRDLVCPLEHSRAIARALPSAELVVYPGVGHMVHLERRAEVSRRLVTLVDRALAGRGALSVG